MHPHRLLVLAAFLLALAAPARAAAPIPAFADGERVLFLGDSITRAGPWHSLIALFHETRFPDRRIEWLNAGVSGDTAEAALRRLDWDVLARNPDRVVVMFGVNDVSITLYDGDNAPDKVAAREEKIATYRRAMRELTGRLRAAGKSVVLVTPPPYEEHGEFPADKVVRPGANAAVTRCAEFTRTLAAEFKLPLVDFNGPMNRLAADFQKTNPAFSLMSDRVHPTPGGYLVMAYHFLKAMGAPSVVATTETVATSFAYRPRALPVPFDDGQRRFLPLVPFQDELNREILRVTGLAKGYYEVVMDGVVVGVWWHEELAAGVNLATVAGTPSYRRAQEIKKNQDVRHAARSIGPRVLAALRHQFIEPAGVDPSDAAAVAALMEGKSEGAQYKRFTGEAAGAALRAGRADEAIGELKKNLPAVQVVIRPVASPAPAEKRRADFDARRSPEAIAALAGEFFPLLVLDENARREARLENRAGLDNVAARLAAKDNPGALTAWRDAWMARLVDGQKLGFGSILNLRALVVPDAKRADVMARADALLEGRLSPDAEPMRPGEVWLAPPPPSPNGENNTWSAALFQPLAQAYLLTKEPRYLERYFAYIDDWAMHEDRDARISPTDISDTESKAAGIVGGVVTAFGAIAAQPGGIELIPPDTLARVQLRLVRLYPALGVIYHASNPQNWTPGGSAALMNVALAFDEFRFAAQLFDLARHRHENYGVIQFFPDGSETENALWYNVHYRDGAVQAVATARALSALPAEARPRWTDPVANDRWISAQEDKIHTRARFFAHMIAPPGRYPIGNRIDSRPVPQGNARLMIEQAAAAGHTDAGRILDALPSRAGPGKDPGFTFSALPWRGSFMFRTGWSNTAAYAHFFSSPYPGGGHALRALKNNNSLGLGIAGRDILVGGSFGSYSYDRSPLRVDGLEQFFNAGLGNPGINKAHKGFAVAYVDPEPPAWRIHDGNTFALAEGEYAGPYGDFLDDHHDRKDYRADFLAARAAGVLTGVVHRRQVFQLKTVGAWVVVDRVSSDHPHDYTLDWRFPIERLTPPANPRSNSKYPYPLARPEDIRIDAGTASISLVVANEPGVILRHFGPAMKFTAVREQGEHLVNDYTLRYKTYDHQHVAGAWSAGAGGEVVVTLVVPTRPGAPSPLGNVTSRGDETSRGFSAVAADGARVGFLAATRPGATLRLGDHAAEAEALLIVGDAVMELGARRAAGPADFVRLAPGAPEVAIYAPIRNIHFAPARTVLLPGEAVTIHCPTPGVAIHYTLDGSDPTADSPRYTGPIAVGKDVSVKARAFRPGTTGLPASLASTHVSPVFSAGFTVETPAAAAPVAASALKPGLAAATRVGPWQDLFFFPERTRIESRAVAPTLFSRVTPRADAAFAVDYEGYFDAPEDGVYTFHAPLELVTSPQEPGYRLHVELAGGSWYPATTRHAYGTWSIALKKGLHPFRVYYADYRRDAVARLNHPGLRLNTIWQGNVPALDMSGPGVERGPIPASFLKSEKL